MIGILGVRGGGSALSDALGWRSVYVVLASLCVVLALVVRLTIPSDVRPTAGRYVQALASMGQLVLVDRSFLSRGLIAFFLFASFGTLWSGLAFLLAAARRRFGAMQIGFFGIAGLAGALAASRAGRWADAGRGQATRGAALVLLTASWLLIVQAGSSLCC